MEKYCVDKADISEYVKDPAEYDTPLFIDMRYDALPRNADLTKTYARLRRCAAEEEARKTSTVQMRVQIVGGGILGDVDSDSMMGGTRSRPGSAAASLSASARSASGRSASAASLHDSSRASSKTKARRPKSAMPATGSNVNASGLLQGPPGRAGAQRPKSASAGSSVPYPRGRHAMVL